MKVINYLKFLLIFHFPLISLSQQSFTILDRFISIKETTNWSNYTEIITDVRKVEKLASISLSDTLLTYDETLEDYFPLDTSEIYFLDINFDGKLDLVYIGMESFTRYMTNMYIQRNEIFQLSDVYSGSTKHIEINHLTKKIRLFTHEAPCCDSYTHSLGVYELSDAGKRELKERILFLDPNGRNFSGVPTFTTENPILLSSLTELCIRRGEFRGRAWFGNPDKTVEMTAKLRDPKVDFIPVADLPVGMEVYIQDQKIIDTKTWYFVLTEQTGALENSLFERWQVRNISENQYLGWIQIK